MNGAEWQSLSSRDDWRGYIKPSLPAGWSMENGVLTRVGEGGDIITKNTYDNFELTLEWKLSKGGNSGIFFRAQEDTAQPIYTNAPEMQVLDNQAHKDGLDPRTSAGSNYALHAPVRDVTRPVGAWNQVRIIANGSHVEHWMNGIKLLEYELWSDDWKQRTANSKFKAWPQYGMARSGHIGLQDHGDWVAFRNIKIRELR